jgi:hypothetical protein
MTMRQQKQWTVLWLVLLVGLTACSYDAAVRRLSPAEQSEWSLYRHRLTAMQEWTYLAKASAAERTAYLRALGFPQRFAALDPLDQQVVRSGWPREGMSAEALLFVWGEPYYKCLTKSFLVKCCSVFKDNCMQGLRDFTFYLWSRKREICTHSHRKPTSYFRKHHET